MIKKIFLFILLQLLNYPLFSQNTEAAKKLLDGVSGKISSFKSKLSKKNPYKRKNSSLRITNSIEFTYKNRLHLLDKKFVHNKVIWK